MLQRARRANQPTDRQCTPTSSHYHTTAAAAASPSVHSRHTAYVVVPSYRRIEPAPTVAQHLHCPVQLAKSWGTPIWTPESTLKFLDKVSAAIHGQKPLTPTSTAANGSASGAATTSSTSSRHSLALQRPRAANTKRLKGDYIKIEATDRHYRPYYKEIHGWPVINLNAEPGYCPFWQDTNADAIAAKTKQPPATPVAVPILPAPTVATADSPAMTRKRRSQTNRTSVTATTATTTHPNATAEGPATPTTPLPTTPAIQKTTTATAGETAQPQANATTVAVAATTAPTKGKCGYCEICHIEYDVLNTHLQSVEHRRYVTNDDNFLTLDTMIGTGASMDTFLARNTAVAAAIKSPTEDQPEPVFGKRSAGKKSDGAKPAFRANGRSIGGTATEHSIKDESVVYADTKVMTKTPKEPTAKRRRRSNNNHAAVLLLTNGGGDVPPLQERSSKAAAKAAVAAVVADEEADDDDEDEDVVMRSSPAIREEPIAVAKQIAQNSMRLSNQQPAILLKDTATVDAADQSNRVRSRRESAKRINYSELQEGDDSPKKKTSSTAAVVDSNSTTVTTASTEEAPKNGRKIQKIRLHGVRWRAPSDEDRRSAMSQPFYKVMDDSQSQLVTSTIVGAAATTKASTSATSKRIADAPSTVTTAPVATENGLKLRVCRVRNSELSALTNEADKFMFPRQNSSSEPPTDEDRQSTSEFGVVAADLSADLMSSEVDLTPQLASVKGQEHRRRSRTDSASSTNPTVATGGPPTTASLDASNKRKRRKQLEAFLNDNSEYYKFDNPDSRLRFHEAPFQPIVGTSSRRTAIGSAAAAGPAAIAAAELLTATATTTTALLTPLKLSKRAAAAAANAPSSPSVGRLTRSAQQQPASPRTPTRASRRPRRDSDDGKGAIGTITPPPAAQSRQPTPTTQDRTSSATPAKHNAWLLSDATESTAHHHYQHETDVTAAMLRTDVVRAHQFAFERVPSAEPWFETFKRQDECREQIFEYWGSTGECN